MSQAGEPSLQIQTDAQSLSAASDSRVAQLTISSQNDFDFHVGNWKIHNRLLKARLQNSDDWIEFESTCRTRKILNGFGNINEYHFQKNSMPFDEGMVLRLLNPKTKLWTINWADNNSVELDVPVIGFFVDKVGTFLSNDTYGGKPIIVRAVYDGTISDEFVWSQAFSADNGKTFETNWIMNGCRQD